MNDLQFDLEVMNGHDSGILSQLTVLGLRKGYKLIGLLHYLVKECIELFVFFLGFGRLNNLPNYMQFDLEVMNGRDSGILSQLTVLGLRKGHELIGLFH